MARNARTRTRRRSRRPRQHTLPTNQQQRELLREWFLPNDGIFSRIKFHGNVKLTPVGLVWLALCWAWTDARNLTDAFREAVGCCRTMGGTVAVSPYQGFMGALVAWTPRLLPVLRDVRQERMQQIGGRFWRIDGWVPIAFDGSRGTAPRTKANEKAFCAANDGSGMTAKYRKKKSQGRRRRNKKAQPQPQEPQTWITMMWHMGLRLPWRWRLGPSNSSERGHVLAMVNAETFPRNTLFCGDAGFVGYPLWSALLQAGHDFLVRVGSKVSLLRDQADCTLQESGKPYRVLCWPKAVSRANQPHDGPLLRSCAFTRCAGGLKWSFEA